MSNLIKIEDTRIAGYSFTESQYKIIKAVESDSIKKAIPLDFRKVLSIAIIKAIAVLGHKSKETSEVLTMATDVYDYALRKYPHVKQEELLLSIQLGSFGEYGEDVVFMSAKNVIGWLKTYLNRKHSVFLSLTKAKENEALRIANNESSEKDRKFWTNFPWLVETEFDIYKSKGSLGVQKDLVVECLEKIGYKSSDGKFLSDVVSGEQKKVFMLEEKSKAIAREVEAKEKTMVVFSVKGVNEKGLEKEIMRNSKVRCLEFYFNSILEIDKEEIKQLIK